MSWTDIFYPGNSGRRNQVVSYLTKFQVLMELNFEETNKLVDLLNDNVHPSTPLQHITLDTNATIGESADKMIKQIEKIQAVIDTVNDKLSEQLEPTLYRQLTSPDVSFKERIAIAKKSMSSIIGLSASVAGIAVITAIKSGVILTGMRAALGTIKTSAIAGVVIGVIALGIDMIVSAIIGAVERDKLEDAITEFETAFKTFEPASKSYTRAIIMVEVRLEIAN